MKTDYAVQIIWSEEDNAYLAITAELPGCIADGKSPEEALTNVRVAIAEWIEVANEDKRPIPPPLNIETYAALQQQQHANLQNHIEEQVKKTIEAVLQQLVQGQQAQTAWGQRGGIVFNPSESLVPSGRFR